MGWWKRIDLVDRFGQSIWFWTVTIGLLTGGPLFVMARATEAFQDWAPLSYGFLGLVVFIVAIVLAPRVKALIPRRTNRWVALGLEAEGVFHSIETSLRLMDVGMPAGRVGYTTFAFLNRMQRLGFAVPTFEGPLEPEKFLKTSLHYLGLVAPLLLEGQVAEAKEMAAHISNGAST